MGSDHPLVMTAAAFIFDHRNRILLIQRTTGRHAYGPPFDIVQPGETPAQAVIRATREQTTATVHIDNLVGMWHFHDEHRLSFAFRVTITAGIPQIPDLPDIVDVSWYDSHDLPLPRSHILEEAIIAAMAGQSGLIRDAV